MYGFRFWHADDLDEVDAEHLADMVRNAAKHEQEMAKASQGAS